MCVCNGGEVRDLGGRGDRALGIVGARQLM